MYAYNLETFALLWLDETVNSSQENRDAQQTLRSTINYVTTFEDPKECQDYILSTTEYDRIVLITSGHLTERIVPSIHNLRQVTAIYVYCRDKLTHVRWTKQFKKVKAVIVELKDLVRMIETDQQRYLNEQDPFIFNTFKVTGRLEQTTTGLNGDFINSLLLFDVLRRMKPSTNEKQELIELCKKEYKGNKTALDTLDKFEVEYSPEKAIFIKKVEQCQCQARIRVYRGQLLRSNELENLKSAINGLISINTFFSTTKTEQQALEFMRQAENPDELPGVLFHIDADPVNRSTRPFADVSAISKYVHEHEILFTVGCIFRVCSIYKRSDQVWIIRLSLCADDDHDLSELLQYLQKRYRGVDNESNIVILGQVLRRMGKLDKAEIFYRRLLQQLPPDDHLRISLNYYMDILLKDKDQLDASLKYFNKSLEQLDVLCSKDYSKISRRCNAIGTIYQMKRMYGAALSWFSNGADLLRKENVIDYSEMAHIYNNMAVVYEKQEKIELAIRYNREVLKIREEHLPHNHADIGLTHHNLGCNYHLLGDYNSALDHYNRSLDIRLKSLPSDHPHIADRYRSIGLVLEQKGDLKKSLQHLETAAGILRQKYSRENSERMSLEADIKRISSRLK